MRKHIAVCAAACVSVLAAAIVVLTTGVAHAADCLAEPGQSTPAGHHWFYRRDHANDRKCWYLKDISGATESKARPQTRRPTARPDDGATGSARGRRADEHDALFEEFLRWQKRQESRR